MDIELREQLRLDCYFGIVCAKQEAIRQNDSCAAIFLQSIHNNGHEQVSRFAAGKVSRKMVLNFRLFRPTIGRIHQDNVYLIVLGIVQNISEKCVIMEHLRHIHIMQQHISDAKNIRKLFLFNSVNGIITQVLVSCCLNFLTQNFQPAGKKATRAAGKIGHLFTDLRVDHLRHKISNSAWRIEFASRTGTL